MSIFEFWAAIALTLIGASDYQQDDSDQAETLESVVAELESGIAKLSPENTSIRFVGTHVGRDPKPRLGGFSEFNGEIKVDSDSNVISSINVEIKIESLWTEFDNLTTHLLSREFFENAKFPKAEFKSDKITTVKNKDSEFLITGELTILGKTVEVEIPASVLIEDDIMTLSAKFEIDRTAFGMDRMTSGVEKNVEIEIEVGRKTKIRKSQPGNGN